MSCSVSLASDSWTSANYSFRCSSVTSSWTSESNGCKDCDFLLKVDSNGFPSCHIPLIRRTGCLSLDSTGSPHPFNVTIPGKLTNVVIGVTVFYLIMSLWSAPEASTLRLDDYPCSHGADVPCCPSLEGARSCSFAFSNRAFVNKCSKSPSLPATFDL